MTDPGMTTPDTPRSSADGDAGRQSGGFRILVTGSRHWADRYTVEVAIRRAVLRSGTTEAVVVHGGADGADACAGVSAVAMGLREEIHPADWKAHGKGAGPIRNAAMVALGADVCLAFPMPGSRGTWDCVQRARAAGIPVVLDLRHAGPCPQCGHDGARHDPDGWCRALDQVDATSDGLTVTLDPCDCPGFTPHRRGEPIIAASHRTTHGACILPGGSARPKPEEGQ